MYKYSTGKSGAYYISTYKKCMLSKNLSITQKIIINLKLLI